MNETQEPEATDTPDQAVTTEEAPEADPRLAELDSLRDRHLRLSAEFDNYRKRTDRERTESGTRAQAQLVERLLDPLDDLQRFAHQDPEKSSPAALLEAAQAVERKLLRALENVGLEPVKAEGTPFDPTIHEAITTVATEKKKEDNLIADVFQPGYLFKGTLVRPARVRVKRYEG
jgi:molecular chaperone GrpE